MIHRTRKHSEIVGQRHVLLFLAQRRRAVFQGDHVKSAFVGTAHRRFHAAVGEETTQNHGLYCLAAQNEIEVGAGKCVQPALPFNQDVTGLRLQCVDNCRAPRPLAKRVIVDDRLQNSIWIAREFAVPSAKVIGACITATPASRLLFTTAIVFESMLFDCMTPLTPS